jgi:predicted phage terminase large subunit-like protein
MKRALDEARANAEDVKARCKSLAGFVREFWPVLEPSTDLKWGWALDAICEHLEAVSDGRIKRLLINVPPGMMKSLIVSVFWPAWEWGQLNRPHLRIIGTSYDADISGRDADRMRTLINSPLYQTLYPHVTLRKDKRSRSNFENTAMGFRQAVGFTNMTGKRGNRVIIDDPHKVKDKKGETDNERKNKVATFNTAVPSRLNDPVTDAIVVIMQRVHAEDVAGEIIKRYPDYVRLILPMEYEPKRHCRTSIGFSDPRTKAGELLFPERFPLEVVIGYKTALGSNAYASQYQQSPYPAGGGLIKGKWFKPYDELPRLRYRAIFADTAQKKEERHDYSVFAVWGMAYDSNRMYLIEVLRGKWEAPQLKRIAIAYWRKHAAENPSIYGPLRGMWVEDKASGTGLIQEIRQEGMFPIVGVQRNRDKVSRVNDASPTIESGMCFIPISTEENPVEWVDDFVAEHEAFTDDMTHAHDDQVDTTCDAVVHLPRALTLDDVL